MESIKNNIVPNISYTYSQLKKLFLTFKSAQGLAPRTIKEYKNTFRIFEQYYSSDNIDIIEMVISLQQMFSKWVHSAPATFNLPYEYLNCFFNWTINFNYMTENPLKLTGLKKKKNSNKIKNIPSDIIQQLLNLLDLKTYTGLRDYCFILLTLDTGIRPCEAVGLDITNANLSNCSLKIPANISKTRTERILPLSFQTCEALRKLIEIRLDGWPNFIFLTINGNQFSTRAWEDRLEVYSDILNYKICPYDFRHTFALLYLKNGGDIFTLKFILRSYFHQYNSNISKFFRGRYCRTARTKIPS